MSNESMVIIYLEGTHVIASPLEWIYCDANTVCYELNKLGRR